jgi:hypothetical protein
MSPRPWIQATTGKPLDPSFSMRYKSHKNKQNSMSFNLQGNYTDWPTATCRRNLVPTFADRGISRGQRSGTPTAVNLSFLYRQFLSKKAIISDLNLLLPWDYLPNFDQMLFLFLYPSSLSPLEFCESAGTSNTMTMLPLLPKFDYCTYHLIKLKARWTDSPCYTGILKGRNYLIHPIL